ncbi:DUF5641 domain-containing protein [Trichonephila clavipes]|uniref:DUF5641 domain-containing protein n=1 Tax=Trichonephila clavipes TaxID=2585209 RepID=A0A8X6W9N1_TRICX|nr:DUF5641 domain-containing protein [Trichonephila clavipes]
MLAQEQSYRLIFSRGCNVDELLKNEMWFSGPDLQTDEYEDNQLFPDPSYRDELKCAVTLSMTQCSSNFMMNSLIRETSGSSRKNNVAVGCLVLLKENDLPPCKWTMARILEVIYGTDAINDKESMYRSSIYDPLLVAWLQLPLRDMKIPTSSPGWYLVPKKSSKSWIILARVTGSK